MPTRSKRTAARRELILRTLRTGLTRRAAAEYADMDRVTLYRWMADDATMRKAVIKAEAEAEVRFATVITSSALGRPAQYDAAGRLVRAEVPASPTDAKWWLTHRRPQDWGDRVTFNLEEAVREVAEEKGMEEADIWAEVDDILGRD